MKLKKKKRFNLNKELNFKRLMLQSVLFSICFLFIGFFFNLIFSFFAYKMKDPTSLLQICGIISLFLSVLITSYTQSKINKQYYFLSGMILGIIILVMLFVISLIISNGNITSNSILLKSLIPAFSVIGSMLGVKKERKRSKIHR